MENLLEIHFNPLAAETEIFRDKPVDTLTADALGPCVGREDISRHGMDNVG